MTGYDLEKFEAALERRNPLLPKKLMPGLPVNKIKKKLERAGITGAIEPIIWLYSWRDGSNEAHHLKVGFFPKHAYGLVYFDLAVAWFKSFKVIADAHPERPELAETVGLFFPILVGGRTRAIQIAVDLDPSNHNRIVMIDTQATKPLRELYASFGDFIADLIRANDEDDSLRCFSEEK